MIPIWTLINKGIQQLHDLAIITRECLLRMILFNVKDSHSNIKNVCIFSAILSYIFVVFLELIDPQRISCLFGYFLKYFDFVVSSLKVVGCALLDFQCYVCVEFEIFRKPNSGEMSPAELLQHDVALNHDFAYVNGMVSKKS